MAMEYIGLDEINGPLVGLSGVTGVSNEEMVQFTTPSGSCLGRVIMLQGEYAVMEVFRSTAGMSPQNVNTRFTGKGLHIPLAKEMLGRTFDGKGSPTDGLGPVYSELERDINAKPINPVSRSYPRNYIHTGISSIDTLFTLIRGQKLPIFSGSGMSHNKLAAQIVRQAQIASKEGDADNFCVVFCAMGISRDVANFFRQSFEETGAINRVCMFLNLLSDPIVERTLAPRCALTAAEYLAFDKGMHVLVVMSDMTSYAEALREFSSSRGEIPGRKGYPGYLYSDLASLFERAGTLNGNSGSLTQIPILTMPNDDITHPVPDLTGYITEGQIVLSRFLEQSGVYPPVDVLPSLSRLAKDGIGEGYTRGDHQALANQLFASYAKAVESRALAGVVGESELLELDKQYLEFARSFEAEFLSQGFGENRTLEQSLDIGWKLLGLLPLGELDRVDKELLKEKLSISDT